MGIQQGGLAAGAILLSGLSAFAQSNDKAQANAYDNPWKTAWVDHCRAVWATANPKTDGFILEIGDSITYSNPYSQWPRQSTSSAAADSPDDLGIFTWCHTSSWNTGSNTDTTVKNGWYLAAADTNPGARGMTASSGIEAVEYLSGNGNGGAAMPSTNNPSTAVSELTDGTTYPHNLQINTVVAAFGDARAAVLMLGTNDVKNGVDAATYLSALGSVVGVLEAQNIVVVLSTLPPSTMFDVTQHNAQIRGYAESHGLPLIDFYEEILSRQPANWSTTLISSDGIHPTASGTGAGGTPYTSASDPYANGGDPATNKTGEACTLVGYLLRSWLTIQKLKEVKSFVADGVNPPPPPPGPSPGNSGGGGGGGGGGLKCGGSGLEAILVLGILRALRAIGSGSGSPRARKALGIP